MNTSFCRRSLAWLLVFETLASLPLQAANTTVSFGNFAFSPKDITIRVGDTVTWSNSGGFHTVTGDGADPFCGTASVPTTCSHTFTSPGKFAYHCVPHQSFGMVGSVTVLAASNAAPSITLAAPAPGAVYSPGANVILAAVASDPDGTVAQVEFFLGSTSAGVLTAAPFSLTLSNLPIGHYTASAKVTDNLGSQATSSTNEFTVTPLLITHAVANAGQLELAWVGGVGPFAVQGKARVEDTDWQDLLTTGESHASVPLGEGVRFLRVVDRAP